MNHATPYADINLLLDYLLTEVRTVLGAYFAGMYLHGSLALHDFVPTRSDIDVLVLTTDTVPETLIPELVAMHNRIARSDMAWARELETTYFSQAAIRRHTAMNPFHPYAGIEAPLVMGEDEPADIIVRHILREHGITLIGPNPHTLVDPIAPEQLRDAVIQLFHDWWEPMLSTNPTFLAGGDYRVYTVLTMCRMLYTLHYGAIVSKSVAARWAAHHVAVQWHSMIQQAARWTHDSDTPFDFVEETPAFIRYTADRIRDFETPDS